MDKRISSGDLPEIEYTTYDRILRAWENSMELVRDFEMYSKRIEMKVCSRFSRNLPRMKEDMRQN